MEKIFEKATKPTKREIIKIKYKAIDGMLFLHEHECKLYERNCDQWVSTYLKLHKLIPRAYSLKEMKKKLQELECHKEEWMQSSLKDWYDYNANVYGLKEAIEIIEKRGE